MHGTRKWFWSVYWLKNDVRTNKKLKKMHWEPPLSPLMSFLGSQMFVFSKIAIRMDAFCIWTISASRRVLCFKIISYLRCSFTHPKTSSHCFVSDLSYIKMFNLWLIARLIEWTVCHIWLREKDRYSRGWCSP